MELRADSTEQIYVRPKATVAAKTLRKLDLETVFIPPIGWYSGQGGREGAIHVVTHEMLRPMIIRLLRTGRWLSCPFPFAGQRPSLCPTR